jgi:hypothetical protein
MRSCVLKTALQHPEKGQHASIHPLAQATCLLHDAIDSKPLHPKPATTSTTVYATTITASLPAKLRWKPRL